MIIAFMGNDGSGKTTTIENFCSYLKNFGVENEYRKEFDYFIIGYLLKIFGKRLDTIRSDFVQRKPKPKTRWYFKLWPFLVIVDQSLFYLYLKILKKETIVILDRYVYDFLMSWEYLGYSNSVIRWLYMHFPKPDLVFICDASAQTCYNRKRKTHSHDLEFYIAQRKRYLKLANNLNIEVINTEKTLNQNLDEIMLDFRKFLINKLSDEEKILIIFSYPNFTLTYFKKLGLRINWNLLNWDHILDMAIKCGVENVLCNNLLRFNEVQLSDQVLQSLRYVFTKSNERVEILDRTLSLVSRKLSEKNINFLVMKTMAPFPYGATDVDLLVRKEDFKKAQEILSSISKDSKRSRLHNAITYQGNLLSLDLHYEISWVGHKVIDEDKVFSRRRKIFFNEIELYVPSLEDELLILSAHSLFQHHYTTLSEHFWIVNLFLNDKIDSEYILDSLSSYGWLQSFNTFIHFLLRKHNLLYGNYYSFTETDSMWRSNDQRISLIWFHPFKFIPKKSPQQFLDYLLTIYRVIRFKLSGKLAYNTNWLKVKG